MPPRHLLDMSLDAIGHALSELGEKPYRAKQIWRWLHSRRIGRVEEMTDLSKNLRERLQQDFCVSALATDEHHAEGDKLTERWLFSAADKAPVETVLIREKRLTRRTVCLSCMAGCPLGCAFCATGQGGYERNLTVGEMLEQVYRVDTHARTTENLDAERAVSHVVFMGMGEPLLTLEPVLETVRRLTAPDGLGLSWRHVTLSTVGIPEGLRRLAGAEEDVRLALSLHASDQKTRERLIPVARQYPLPRVIDALGAFAASAKRDITIEYCLIRNVNDSQADIQRLTALLQGIPCKLNLIPLNPTPGFDGAPPPPEHVRRFREGLEARGLPATIRVEKGGEINAACGQLRAGRKDLDNPSTPSL